MEIMKNTTKFFLIAVFLHISLQSKEINFNNLVETAKKSNKHIFVLLHKTGCGYCVRMKNSTIKDPKIHSILDKYFIYVNINVHDRDIVIYEDFMGTSKEFAIDVGYDFYPSSLFIDYNGDIVYDVAGYKEKEVFEKMLNYVKTNSYEYIDFSGFNSKFN